MEKVSELYKAIKERLSNPLVSSFIISWFIINWRIVIGLLFYKSDQLKADGYFSYIHLIKSETDISNFLWHPLLCSLAYVFIFPFIKLIISAFGTWITSKNTDWNLRISKEGKMPVDKYIKLRELYDKRTKILEEVMEKETNFVKENESLMNEKFHLQRQYNDAFEELKKVRSFADASFLNGEWEIKYRINNHIVSERVRIWNSDIIHSNSKGNDELLFKIIAYGYNSQMNGFIMRIKSDFPVANTIYNIVLLSRDYEKEILKNIEEEGIIYELIKIR
jgi:hypothetical protein